MTVDIKKALRAEIERVARREIRAQTAVLRKSVSRYRSDIAELKRRNLALEKRLDAMLKDKKQQPPATPKSAASQPTGRLRFSPAYLKKHREKTGLSAADYARLAGVSAISIYNWENGKSRPGSEKLARLAEMRKLGKRDARARLLQLAES